jgi:hypothetical protein
MGCSNVWISRDGQRIEVGLGASGDAGAATAAGDSNHALFAQHGLSARRLHDERAERLTLGVMPVSSIGIGVGGVECAQSWLGHRLNDESVETVGQQVSQLSEFQGSELRAGIASVCPLRAGSTTTRSRPLRLPPRPELEDR